MFLVCHTTAVPVKTSWHTMEKTTNTNKHWSQHTHKHLWSPAVTPGQPTNHEAPHPKQLVSDKKKNCDVIECDIEDNAEALLR